MPPSQYPWVWLQCLLTSNASSVEPPLASAASREATSPSHAAPHTSPARILLWLHVPEWMWPAAECARCRADHLNTHT